ncbi:MAG: hypothetical protein HY471_00525 [Candidatus Sungbacteria bacterium]|nr:hypothetical protein [Candidatus Sungbacteria bacterium]
MRNIIEEFPKQLVYEPVVENGEKLKTYQRFVVLGMGGSHLAGDILKVWDPTLSLSIHSDYGLPKEPLDKETTLIVAVSYSGNTEEPIDGFEEARAKGLPLAVIAAGGRLMELAKEAQVPYVQLTDKSVPPRMALGYMTKSLLALMRRERELRDIAKLAQTFNPLQFEEEAKRLAEALRNAVPVVYASAANTALAMNWKIKFNETAKIPAFYNVLPELNHNEMNGFDGGEKARRILGPFHFIFLRDSGDDLRVQRRMDVLAELYRERNLPISEVTISHASPWMKIFGTLIRGDWLAYILALFYGHEPAAVPMVEEFKRRIAG